jgi:hypothetical protein
MNFARMALPFLAAIVASLLCATSLMGAPTNATPQILFLQLKMQHDTISRVKSSISPGILKPQPNPKAREIQYELVSASGEVFWRGGLDDPSVREVEHEDPPGSGQRKRRTVRLDVVEFSIRVPVISGAQRLEFFRLETPLQDRSGEKTVRKLFGSLPVPANGDGAP